MQRLMIARIFLLKPKILLADEPTSMIDACSRATILDMLLKLRKCMPYRHKNNKKNYLKACAK